MSHSQNRSEFRKFPGEFLAGWILDSLHFRRALGTEKKAAFRPEAFCDVQLLPARGAADSPRGKCCFERALERVRKDYGLLVYGYVVMPEHVHLLVSEPERETLAVAIQSLKQGVARRFIGEADHFWQKRYYDFNVYSGDKFIEKLRYIAIR